MPSLIVLLYLIFISAYIVAPNIHHIVINNDINDEFGLGDTRSLQDYENLCGVDLKNMKVLDKQKAYTSEFISKLSWQDSSF